MCVCVCLFLLFDQIINIRLFFAWNLAPMNTWNVDRDVKFSVHVMAYSGCINELAHSPNLMWKPSPRMTNQIPINYQWFSCARVFDEHLFVFYLWIIKFLKFSQRGKKIQWNARDFYFIERRISKKLAATWIDKNYLWNRLWWIKIWKTRKIFATMLSLCLLLKLEALRVCVYFCTEFFKSQQRRRQILESKWRLR